MQGAPSSRRDAFNSRMDPIRSGESLTARGSAAAVERAALRRQTVRVLVCAQVLGGLGIGVGASFSPRGGLSNSPSGAEPQSVPRNSRSAVNPPSGRPRAVTSGPTRDVKAAGRRAHWMVPPGGIEPPHAVRKPREHADGMRLRYVSAGSGSGTALVDL
jgi:hypothetical protein